MEEAVALMYNIARIVIILGGAGAAIAIAIAGLLYIFAGGDPQKQRIVRDAFIGAIVGMCVCGAAFIVPRVISNFVLEPSGGESITGLGAVSCVETLKNRLVIETQASTADRMNQVIAVIQARQSDCAKDNWSPVAHDIAGSGTSTVASTCADAPYAGKVGGFDVPSTLQQKPTGTVTADNFVRLKSSRDTEGNIIIHFTTNGDPVNTHPPADNALCWMYLTRSQSWFSQF